MAAAFLLLLLLFLFDQPQIVSSSCSVQHLLHRRPGPVDADPLCGLPANQDKRTHGCSRSVKCVWSVWRLQMLSGAFIYLFGVNVVLNYLSLCSVELAHMCIDFKKLRLQISRYCLGTFSVLDEDNIFIMCHFLFIMQHMMKLRKSLWCVEYYKKSCSGLISPFRYAETSSSQFCWDVQFCSQFQSGP